MEADASEFPIIQTRANNAQSTSNNAVVNAFHCCHLPKCNGNHSGLAEGSVKSAQAVLAAALKSSIANEPKAVIGYNSSSIATSSNSSTFGKVVEAMASGPGPAMIVLGEPNPPSALKSDNIGSDESTNPSFVPTPPMIFPDDAPVIQTMAHDDAGAVGNLEHVINKRHDSQKGT